MTGCMGDFILVCYIFLRAEDGVMLPMLSTGHLLLPDRPHSSKMKVKL